MIEGEKNPFEEATRRQNNLRMKYGGILVEGEFTMDEFRQHIDRQTGMPGLVDIQIQEPELYEQRSVEEIAGSHPGSSLELQARPDFDGSIRLLPRFVMRPVTAGLTTEDTMISEAQKIIVNHGKENRAVAQAEHIIYSLGEDL